MQSVLACAQHACQRDACARVLESGYGALGLGFICVRVGWRVRVRTDVGGLFPITQTEAEGARAHTHTHQ